MARTITKPIIRIVPEFTGERTVVDAFGEAYARYYDKLEKLNSSGHTFDTSKLSEYNFSTNTKEVQRIGSATA